VGTVVDGYLLNGKRLPPTGAYHRATPDQKNRGTWEGSDEMVALLLHGAEHYAKVRPGHKLSIANIGRRGGGRILWSVSHRNGRDADILFPVLDDTGAPVEMDKMVHLDSKGQGETAAGQTIHLDVDGMLALVVGLVDQRITEIQHLFVSNPIRKMVLKNAEAQRLPRSLIKRIKAVLRQPRGALPHDDHLHIRIGCSTDDVLDGCRHLSRGAFKKSRANRVTSLLKQVRSKDPDLRVQSIDMLGRLGFMDKKVAKALKTALSSSLELRRAAITALRGQSGKDADRLLVKSLTRGAPVELSVEALKTIEARVEGRWTQSLTVLLQDRRNIPQGNWPGLALRTVREEALWLAGLTGDSNLVQRIIPLVDHPRLGTVAHEALERITLLQVTSTTPTASAWRSSLPRKSKRLRKDIRERIKNFRVLRRNGRPYYRGCYRALDHDWHAVRNLGRRILDQSHPRAIHQPRWSPTDLRWYWRRKLRIR
jgi:penicillin-insensitive murein endopeptidase